MLCPSTLVAPFAIWCCPDMGFANYAIGLRVAMTLPDHSHQTTQAPLYYKSNILRYNKKKKKEKQKLICKRLERDRERKAKQVSFRSRFQHRETGRTSCCGVMDVSSSVRCFLLTTIASRISRRQPLPETPHPLEKPLTSPVMNCWGPKPYKTRKTG